MDTDNQEINSKTDEENKDSMKTDSGGTAAEKTAAEKTDSEKAEIPSLEAIEAERNRLSEKAEKPSFRKGRKKGSHDHDDSHRHPGRGCRHSHSASFGCLSHPWGRECLFCSLWETVMSRRKALCCRG